MIGDQSGLQVFHNGGTDGSDVLTGIEILRFSDGDLPVATGFTGIYLVGTPVDDNGLPGNPEVLVGTILNDTIEGLEGDDSLVGLSGEDSLDGGAGADTIDGGGESDEIFGGSGEDLITGGTGDDTIDGGTGLDVAVYVGQSTDFEINGNQTSATVTDLAPDDAGDEGSDSLTGIRILRFADQDVVFNILPETVAESYTSPEDNVFEVAATELLAGDSNADGDPLIISAVQNAVNGTVALVGDVVRFTPAQNFNGPASFEYVVSDGFGTTAQVVTLDITPVEDPPKAADDDGFTTEFGTALDIDVGELLANDDDGDPELDQVLSITAVGGAANGTVALSGDTITFTPTPGYTGPASFTYDLSDGNGGTDTATVSLTVGENTPPGATDDSYSLDEDGVLTVAAAGVLANDTDADDDSLSATLLGDVSHGVLGLNPDGSFSYTPNADYTGTDSFTYTLSDGNSGTDTATVTLDIGPVNDAPVAEDDTASTDEDMPVTIAVLDNDTDIDGDALTVASVTQGANGGVEIEPDGTVTYTPDPDFNGTDSFSYTLSDANGGTDTAMVEVNVEGVDTDYVEILGTSRSDLLIGRPGQMDAIFGFRGNDWIFGFSGDDLLVGGKGNDLTFGGAGDDRLLFEGGRHDRAFGGRGADTFELTETMLNDGHRGRMEVLDYAVGIDRVDIGDADIVSVKETHNGVRLIIGDDRDVLILKGVDRFDQIEFVNLTDPDIDVPQEPRHGAFRHWADTFLFGKSRGEDRSLVPEMRDIHHADEHPGHGIEGSFDNRAIPTPTNTRSDQNETSGAGGDGHGRLEVAGFGWDDPLG